MPRWKTEKQFQASCERELNKEGLLWWHLNDARGTVPGLPDLFVVKNEVLYCYELKMEDGKLSKAQEDWQRILDGAITFHSIERLDFPDRFEGEIQPDVWYVIGRDVRQGRSKREGIGRDNKKGFASRISYSVYPDGVRVVAFTGTQGNITQANEWVLCLGKCLPIEYHVLRPSDYSEFLETIRE